MKSPPLKEETTMTCTYDDLERIAWKRDDRDFEWVRGMEAIIANETGHWPDANDPAPDWMIDYLGYTTI